MNSDGSKRHIEAALRRAPIFLALALAVFVVSLWLGQRSLTYVAGAVISGLVLSALTLLGWRLRADRPMYWTLAVLNIFILNRSETIIRRLAFPNVSISDLSWAVLFQFLSVTVAILFGVLWAFRSPIKSFSRL